MRDSTMDGIRSTIGRQETAGCPRLRFSTWVSALWPRNFCKLALALQRQLERVCKIRFGLFDGFALRNRGGKLFHKTSVATLFCGLKNGCQFHARRLSHLLMAC